MKKTSGCADLWFIWKRAIDEAGLGFSSIAHAATDSKEPIKQAMLGFEYLFGSPSTVIYKIAFIIVVIVGCTSSLELIWEIADTLNGLMAIPNLIGIALLSSAVVKLTKEYIAERTYNE